MPDILISLSRSNRKTVFIKMLKKKEMRMSMLEHAIGVVDLERFAEISHMDHDEIGCLLFDTMAENAKLKKYIQEREILLNNVDGLPNWYVHNPEVLWPKDPPNCITIKNLNSDPDIVYVYVPLSTDKEKTNGQ